MQRNGFFEILRVLFWMISKLLELKRKQGSLEYGAHALEDVAVVLCFP